MLTFCDSYDLASDFSCGILSCHNIDIAHALSQLRENVGWDIAPQSVNLRMCI